MQHYNALYSNRTPLYNEACLFTYVFSFTYYNMHIVIKGELNNESGNHSEPTKAQVFLGSCQTTISPCESILYVIM